MTRASNPGQWTECLRSTWWSLPIPPAGWPPSWPCLTIPGQSDSTETVGSCWPGRASASASCPIYKHVQLTLATLPSAIPTDRLMLPVSWEAVGGLPLFPRMEGTIHVQPDQVGYNEAHAECQVRPAAGEARTVDRRCPHA